MIDRVIDSRGLDSFDLRFMGLIAVILSVGVLSIYSVTHSQDTAFPFYLKQLVWILLGTVAFLVMYLSDYHKIARLEDIGLAWHDYSVGASRSERFQSTAYS